MLFVSKKIKFKNLGFIVIDEQHKFGVRQRLELAKKGGNNCDVVVVSYPYSKNYDDVSLW